MSTPLFDTAPRFDSGVELTQADHVRLGAQLQRIYDVLYDGLWHSVPEIAQRAKAPEVSTASQVRNLRKAKHGGHTIERRRVGYGFEFRLVKP